MRTAFDRMNVVGVGENRFVDGVGPLQRDFDLGAVAIALEKDDVVDRLIALGQRLDELGDAALVVELFLLAVALIAGW